MSLDALGNIGDFLGGIAVIITLIYLAIQIRQNTSTVRANGAAAHNQGLNNIMLLLAQDDDARELYFRGLAEYDGLSETQKRKFDSVVLYFVQGILRSFHLHREGVISEDAWQESLYSLKFLGEQPGFHRMWSTWGPRHAPEFRKFMDEELASIRSAEVQ